MDLSFECTCGESVEGFTRSDQGSADLRIPCEACGARYAISITQLQPVDAEGT